MSEKYLVLHSRAMPVNLGANANDELNKIIDDYNRKISDERNRQMTYFACTVFKQLGPVNMAEMELVEETRRNTISEQIETVWFFRRREESSPDLEHASQGLIGESEKK